MCGARTHVSGARAQVMEGTGDRTGQDRTELGEASGIRQQWQCGSSTVVVESVNADVVGAGLSCASSSSLVRISV